MKILPYVTRDQLEQAKKIDLLTYLQQAEPDELVKLSNNMYSVREHDSLKISNGLWRQWSTGIGGRSALDYLIKIRGMSLPEAVQQINERTVGTPSFFHPRDQNTPAPFVLPERNDSNSRVIRYLKGRGIDVEIINELIQRGRIYEEREHHNVVFVGIDSDGVPRHATMRATINARFMYDVEGSDKHFSFSIFAQRNTAVHVFEGAIDALSFLTIEKENGNNWHEYNVISLSGVTKTRDCIVPVALHQYMADHKNTDKVFIHFDNDKAGRTAAEQLQKALASSVECFDRPPESGKDYNDYLQSRHQTKQGVNYHDRKYDKGDSR